MDHQDDLFPDLQPTMEATPVGLYPADDGEWGNPQHNGELLTTQETAAYQDLHVINLPPAATLESSDYDDDSDDDYDDDDSDDDYGGGMKRGHNNNNKDNNDNNGATHNKTRKTPFNIPLPAITDTDQVLDPKLVQIRHIPMTAITMEEIRRRRQGVNRAMTPRQFKHEYNHVAQEITTKLNITKHTVLRQHQQQHLLQQQQQQTTVSSNLTHLPTLIEPPAPPPLPIDDVLVTSPFHVIEHAINREVAQYSILLQPQHHATPHGDPRTGPLPDFSNLPRFGASIPNIEDLEAPLEHIKRHRFTQLLDQPLPTGQNQITVNHIKDLEQSLDPMGKIPLDGDQVLIKVCVFDAFTQMLMMECIVTDDMPLTALRDAIGTQCLLDQADLFDIDQQIPCHVEYERPQDVHVENVMTENALYEDLVLALEQGYEYEIWIQDDQLPSGGMTKVLTYEDLQELEYYHSKGAFNLSMAQLIRIDNRSALSAPGTNSTTSTTKATRSKPRASSTSKSTTSTAAATTTTSSAETTSSSQQPSSFDLPHDPHLITALSLVQPAVEDIILPHEIESYLQHVNTQLSHHNNNSNTFQPPPDLFEQRQQQEQQQHNQGQQQHHHQQHQQHEYQDHVYIRNELDISGETTLEATLQPPLDYCDYLLLQEKEKLGRGDVVPSNTAAYHKLRQYNNEQKNWLSKWLFMTQQLQEHQNYQQQQQQQQQCQHRDDNDHNPQHKHNTNTNTLSYLNAHQLYAVDSALDMPFKYSQASTGWIPRTLQLQHPSNFFLIGNTFYDDRRSPISTSLSDTIIRYSLHEHPTYDIHALPNHHLYDENVLNALKQHLSPSDRNNNKRNNNHNHPAPPLLAPERQTGEIAQQRHVHGGVGIFKQYHAETTTFADIPFRIGEQYLWQHQGNCQHVVMFTEMRIRSSQDYDDKRMYPLVVYRSAVLQHNFQKQIIPTHYLTRQRTTVRTTASGKDDSAQSKPKRIRKKVDKAQTTTAATTTTTTTKNKKKTARDRFGDDEDDDNDDDVDDDDILLDPSDDEESKKNELDDDMNDKDDDAVAETTTTTTTTPINKPTKRTKLHPSSTLCDDHNYPGTILSRQRIGKPTAVLSDLVQVPFASQSMYEAQLNKAPLEKRLTHTAKTTYDPTIERMDQCLTCDGPAMFLVHADRLMPFNTTPLCRYCYDLIHYIDTDESYISTWHDYMQSIAPHVNSAENLLTFTQLLPKEEGYEDFDTQRIFPLQKEYTLQQKVVKVKLARSVRRRDVLRFKQGLYDKVMALKAQARQHQAAEVERRRRSRVQQGDPVAQRAEVVAVQEYNRVVDFYHHYRHTQPTCEEAVKQEAHRELSDIHSFLGL